MTKHPITGEKTYSKNIKFWCSSQDDALKMYRKLEDFIEELIENIQDEDFYELCTARQLSDAISYCLMVSSRVLHKSPIYLPLSNHLLFEVIHTLFYLRIKSSNQLGIYNYISANYRNNEKSIEFLQQISNGYLWIALLYTIISNKYENPSEVLQNSIVLKYLFMNKELYSHMDLNKLGVFSSQQNLKENLNKLFMKLPKLISSFDKIENHFDQTFDDLKMKSINRYEEGQIIFNTRLRWAKVLCNDDYQMTILTLRDGCERNIKHQNNSGYWISPELLKSKKNEVTKLFEQLENEFNT
jgi:hypothetical protein